MSRSCLPAPVRRLLTTDEAAAYAGLGRDLFLANCPVPPRRVHAGHKGMRYDVRELDPWIDRLPRAGARASLATADYLGQVGEDDGRAPKGH